MAKTPSKTDKTQYIGIELEFYGNVDRNIHSTFRNHGISRYAEIGSDSSIRVPNNDMSMYQTAELRILCPYPELADVMSTLQDYLNQVKAKVNETCGLHVHLDMRNQDASKAYSNLIARQEEMYKSIPSKRRSNQYCTKTSATKSAKIMAFLSGRRVTKTELNDAMKEFLARFGANELIGDYDTEVLVDRILDETQGEGMSDHRDGISANPMLSNKYLTLEVRLHEGTTNANEIRRWARYLYEVAFKGNPGTLSTAYIKERMKKHG